MAKNIEVEIGGERMNEKYRKKEGKLTVTPSILIRGSGVFALVAGALYIVIQLIHPADQLSSVSLNSWVLVAGLTVAMSIFSLIGMTGIYLSQLTESGWTGLIGYLTFGLFWLISMAFSFMEAFVLPLLTTDAPLFVEGIVGIFDGEGSEVELGFFPVLAPVAGILYMLGGLLFGIATFRARVLPRLAGALLAFGAVVTLAASVIPHPLDRILAVPMGVAFIWLGFSLLLKGERVSDMNHSSDNENTKAV